MRLQGKTTLVTGATSGIGQGIAEAFAREGARVIVTGRDAARGQDVARGIMDAGGTAVFLAAALDSVAAVQDLAARATAAFGQIDVLVNNAGIFTFAPAIETDEAQYDAMMLTNVKMPFFLTAALVPGMIERGTGKIINITTMVAHMGAPGTAAYGATKAAVSLLTKAWAVEYAPRGINVNAISPGPIRTPGTAAMGGGLDQMASTLPAGRVGLPADIAAAAVYFASDESNFVHGAELAVDGGSLAA